MCDRKLEAGRSLNGGFTASKLKRSLARLGQLLPLAGSADRSLESLLHSETGLMAYSEPRPLQPNVANSLVAVGNMAVSSLLVTVKLECHLPNQLGDLNSEKKNY